MRIDILTIFPSMFGPACGVSILKRAQEAGRVRIHVHDIRAHSRDRHRKVDDRPYGGGSGMVMTCPPIFACARAALRQARAPRSRARVVLLSPRGRRLTQKDLERFARYRQLVLICGHYEGVDERVAEYLADEEISIGDYVLTGGEAAALVVVDGTVRLLPGVLGNEDSLSSESFHAGLLEYPQYTRPAVFRGRKVPDVLLTGDHPRIAAWRAEKSLETTQHRRPDLLAPRAPAGRRKTRRK